MEHASLFLTTHVQALGHTAQDTFLGPYRLHFTKLHSFRPGAVVVLPNPLVYQHADCTPAEPVLSQGRASVLEGGQLPGAAASLVRNHPGPVDEWTGGAGVPASVEELLNPPPGGGGSLGSAGEVLRPDDPTAPLPVFNDAVGHLSDDFTPGGARSNTQDIVTHFVFDYRYIPSSAPCPRSGTSTGTGGGSGAGGGGATTGTGGGTSGGGAGGPTDTQPPLVAEPGSAPDYDDSGPNVAFFQVKLERVDVRLERYAHSEDQTEIHALERHKLFVATRVTAQGHDTQEAHLGLYPLHFTEARSVTPTAHVQLYNRLVYSHPDCTPAEPVVAHGQATIVGGRRLAQAAQALLGAGAGPFDQPSGLAGFSGAAQAILNPPSIAGTPLPGASGTLPEGSIQDLIGQGKHGLGPGVGSRIARVIVHYYFSYDYVVSDQPCPGAGVTEGGTGSPGGANTAGPLSATATASTLSAHTGEPVQLSGGASGGTGPYGFSWAFGDGQQATGASSTHAYAAPGTYHVVLIVTDAAGKTATASVDIVVTAAQCSPQPSANMLSSSDPLAGIPGSVQVQVIANCVQMLDLGAHYQDVTAPMGETWNGDDVHSPSCTPAMLPTAMLECVLKADGKVCFHLWAQPDIAPGQTIHYVLKRADGTILFEKYLTVGAAGASPDCSTGD